MLKKKIFKTNEEYFKFYNIHKKKISEIIEFKILKSRIRMTYLERMENE